MPISDGPGAGYGEMAPVVAGGACDSGEVASVRINSRCGLLELLWVLDNDAC